MDTSFNHLSSELQCLVCARIPDVADLVTVIGATPCLYRNLRRDDHVVRVWLMHRSVDEMTVLWERLISSLASLERQERQFDLLTHPDVRATYSVSLLATALLRALDVKKRWLSARLHKLVPITMSASDTRIVESMFGYTGHFLTRLFNMRIQVYGQPDWIAVLVNPQLRTPVAPHSTSVRLSKYPTVASRPCLVTLVLGSSLPDSVPSAWEFMLSTNGPDLLWGINPGTGWDQMVRDSFERFTVETGETEAFCQYLLKQHPLVDLNTCLTGSSETPLIRACTGGSAAVIMQVLDYPGVDAAVATQDGRSALETLADRQDPSLDIAFERLAALVKRDTKDSAHAHAC